MGPISAVIPNKDGANLLRRILPPLLKELPSETHEVLVVDDASGDDSLQVLAQEFPSVRIVALEANVGFGAACNRGFEEARQERVLLLNSDMEVTAGSVALLAAHLDDPEVFAAGPRYVDVGSAPEVEEAGAESVRPQLGSPAGGGVFSRAKFLELGGFDSLYHPFYWEDLDLGWSAWQRGWRILHDARAHFLHLGSVTISRLYTPGYVRSIRARNRLLFGWKNLRRPSLLLRFWARAMARSVAALARRGDASELLGHLRSVPRLPAALRRRWAAPRCHDEPRSDHGARPGAGSPAQ